MLDECDIQEIHDFCKHVESNMDFKYPEKTRMNIDRQQKMRLLTRIKKLMEDIESLKTKNNELEIELGNSLIKNLCSL